jgi:hypothetical protein
MQPHQESTLPKGLRSDITTSYSALTLQRMN